MHTYLPFFSVGDSKFGVLIPSGGRGRAGITNFNLKNEHKEHHSTFPASNSSSTTYAAKINDGNEYKILRQINTSFPGGKFPTLAENFVLVSENIDFH